MDTNLNAWLYGLKEGERVIVSHRRGNTVRKVERLTATMVVLEGGTRFSRKHGGEVGASPWDAATLEQATPEKMQALSAKLRHNALVRACNGVNWETLPPDTLEAVLALVGKAMTPLSLETERCHRAPTWRAASPAR